ncbi:MAG: mucoidy inhibitor MuiA family protein [Sedimentisphaerales bacterium]|nr:mucoidy inhibitor MuiA family protein [Sedimentisphaerales bacterium]
MKKFTGIMAAVMMLCVCPIRAANIMDSTSSPQVETSGVPTEVIVYRGQALVIRTIEAELPEGSSEIIVRGLPDKLINDTLSAQAPQGVTISSVRYREKKTGEDNRQEVKELETRIEQFRKDQYETRRELEISGWMFDRFGRYWDLPAEIGRADQNRPALAPEDLEKMASFLEKRSSEWHKNRVKNELKQQEIDKELGKLEKKLNELRSQVSKFEKEAVISVTQNRKGRVNIKLSYIVGGANWLPQYNIRAHQDKATVSVEYNALVFQTSGEDWNDVSVKLSTAVPAMVAASPAVEPMKVTLGKAGSAPHTGAKTRALAPAAGVQVQEEYMDLSRQMDEYQARRQQSAAKGKWGQTELNKAAMDNQILELRADKDAAQVIQARAKQIAQVEGISVTYDIPGRLWVPSKTEQQLVNIASFESKADFVFVGSPILTNYVYVEGQIANDSDTILLAGPASMYRDVEFAGKGQVEMVTKGEKFTAGFGVDSQIRISREMKDKKVDTLFGNRIDKFEYRIAIENYKNTPVRLRLVERIPYTEDNRIEIREFATNTPLSKDQDYLRTLKDKGILRWDIELAPNAVSDKARVVTYGYTMKYDNEMQIQSTAR